jgi:hypothetical protein
MRDAGAASTTAGADKRTQQQPARCAGLPGSSAKKHGLPLLRRMVHPLRVEERGYFPLDTDTNIVDAPTLGVYH